MSAVQFSTSSDNVVNIIQNVLVTTQAPIASTMIRSALMFVAKVTFRWQPFQILFLKMLANALA